MYRDSYCRVTGKYHFSRYDLRVREKLNNVFIDYISLSLPLSPGYLTYSEEKECGTSHPSQSRNTSHHIVLGIDTTNPFLLLGAININTHFFRDKKRRRHSSSESDRRSRGRKKKARRGSSSSSSEFKTYIYIIYSRTPFYRDARGKGFCPVNRGARYIGVKYR
eukprot:sb/3472598/